MIQEIIVLTIVFGAAFYAVWATVKSLRKKSAGGCGDDCSCSAKSDFKKALLKNQSALNGKQFHPIK